MPLFRDKHLSFSWLQGRVDVRWSRELKLQFVARLSTLFTMHVPDLEIPYGARIGHAVECGYADLEAYGFRRSKTAVHGVAESGREDRASCRRCPTPPDMYFQRAQVCIHSRYPVAPRPSRRITTGRYRTRFPCRHYLPPSGGLRSCSPERGAGDAASTSGRSAGDRRRNRSARRRGSAWLLRLLR